jgi:glucose/arabinose dehydrogenase
MLILMTVGFLGLQERNNQGWGGVMMRVIMILVASALLSGTSALAIAQTNIERLGQFKTTGVTEMPEVEQSGERADQLRKNLERINLPPGFRIDLYAVAPDARHMAVAPQGTVVFVGTRKNDVWSVVDRDGDRVADQVMRFAPSVDLDIPNGLCFSKDGFLYLVERNRVLFLPAAEFFFEGPDVVALPIVDQGELIPPDEESYNHTARVCRIGPDGKLYITLGQPFNVFAPEKMDLYDKVGIGGIIRMNTDGSGREVVAYGLRNSVGMDFNPANGDLWFTDNQVDGMGADMPPGELNRMTSAGQHFGFPW